MADVSAIGAEERSGRAGKPPRGRACRNDARHDRAVVPGPIVVPRP
jgi:hypothetical protein